MSARPALETLPSRVAKFIRDKELAHPGEKWLVGVSGGPDSCCLLYLLCGLRQELGIRLHVVHLDHGLRPEAGEDARYVAELSSRLNVPFSSGKKDVIGFKKQHRCSLEEAAREVRYHFFQEEAAAQGASRVALAHTSDDQAETVLLHLIRGSGGWGLRGMPLAESWHSITTGARVNVVRPLLGASRAETESYCRDHDIQPRKDSSNLSPEFLRNRVRSEVLPLLKIFNPRITESLSRTADLVAQEQESLDIMASPLVARILRTDGGKVLIDVGGMMALPVGMQRFLLRSAWALARGTLRDLEARHVEQMRMMLSGGAGKRINLPGNMVYCRDYDQAVLAPEVPAQAPVAGYVSLDVPGEATAVGYRFRAEVSSSSEGNLHQIDPLRVRLDAKVAGRGLLVRTRQPGDRFQPLGMAGEKKLQDFMVDAHIPQRLRSEIPLVCSANQILWIVGHRIDDRARVTDSTTEILTMVAAPADSHR